jgi:aminopeptidase N
LKALFSFGGGFAIFLLLSGIFNFFSPVKLAVLNNSSASKKSDFDITFQRMDWRIDPRKAYISGSVKTIFTSKISSLDNMIFDLKDSMQVDSILSGGQLLSYVHSDDKILISLPFSVPMSQVGEVEVYYQGIPQESGLGSFQIGTHSTGPILATLSEPYGAANWWPCKMGLTDKIDSCDILITTDTAYKAGSNGILFEEVYADSLVTYHWKHRYPVATYLVAIAVSNYEEYIDWAPGSIDSFPILNYVYPQNLASTKTKTPEILPVIDFFNSKFGIYPFEDEKYGHAQWNWGGGMEHQSMSFMKHFGFSLMTHEVAHQWFGDKITLGSWQDIWLNEGFATYLNGLAYEQGLGTTPWDVWKSSIKNNIVSKSDGSVWCPDTLNIARLFDGRLTYNKGAFLLHMLRWKIGDEAFFDGLWNYINDPELSFGFSRTADLQFYMELTSGTGLDEFFDDWFYGEGHPRFEILWEQNVDGEVKLNIIQEPSHPSVAFFNIPLPLLFSDSESGYDTLVVFEPQELESNFSMILPNIDDLIFDPDTWLVAQATVERGGEKINPKLDIVLYPNPTSDLLKVSLKGKRYFIEDIRLLDTRGRLMADFPSSMQPVSGFEIPLYGMSNGVYILSFTADDKLISKRVIKK